MLLTLIELAVVVMFGCASEVLLVLIRDRTLDAVATDVAKGCADVSPAVSREAMTDC